MRTGILGGTFDPIHVAHLHSAECALHQLGLDRVLIIPAGDPWQKSDRDISAGRHRLEMCRLAVEGVPGLEVDDREMTREGPTFTIDTLDSFPGDEELYLIVGADAAAGLDSWHRWNAIAERATVSIAPRPGVHSPEFPDAIHIEMGMLEISGTDIRARVREGRPFRYLVTREVHAFIVDNDLYANESEDDMVGQRMDMETTS